MAKKSKAAKKNVAKKSTVKKGVTKKSIVKKATPKKAVAKKKIVKKAAPKKAVVKKAIVKKAVPKKVSTKKPAIKKPVAKKAIVKKAASKKPVAKKTAVIKVVPAKAIARPASPAAKKKTTPLKTKKPIEIPDTASLPPASELSEELVEKAANINGSKPMVVPGGGLNEAAPVTTDPVQAFDKNVFNKATAKGDPHSNLQFSSKPKNSIRPSGKKPLW